MPVSAYKYRSADGVDYQAILPDELAVALSYEAASGGEIYLPSFVSPRFAVYYAGSAKLSLSAVVTRPDIFGNLPPVITLAGINYDLVSAVGESRNAVPPSAVLALAGLQGPKGDPGADAVISYLNVDMGGLVTPAAGATVTLLDFGTPAAGTYLLNAKVTATCGATTTGSLTVDTSNGSPLYRSTQRMVTASGTYAIPLNGLVTLNGSTPFKINGTPSVASIQIVGTSGSIVFTSGSLLKVA